MTSRPSSLKKNTLSKMLQNTHYLFSPCSRQGQRLKPHMMNGSIMNAGCFESTPFLYQYARV